MICIHLLAISGASKNTPVTLPPGRFRLCAAPAAIGSDSRSSATMGMVCVARRAASRLPDATARITSTRLSANSLAYLESNWLSPSADLMTRFTFSVPSSPLMHLSDESFPLLAEQSRKQHAYSSQTAGLLSLSRG